MLKAMQWRIIYHAKIHVYRILNRRNWRSFALYFQHCKSYRSKRIRPEDEARQFLNTDKPGFESRFINEHIGECMHCTVTANIYLYIYICYMMEVNWRVHFFLSFQNLKMASTPHSFFLPYTCFTIDLLADVYLFGNRYGLGHSWDVWTCCRLCIIVLNWFELLLLIPKPYLYATTFECFACFRIWGFRNNASCSWFISAGISWQVNVRERSNSSANTGLHLLLSVARQGVCVSIMNLIIKLNVGGAHVSYYTCVFTWLFRHCQNGC